MHIKQRRWTLFFVLIYTLVVMSQVLYAKNNTDATVQSMTQCTGQYALCDASDCIKSSDGKQAMCHCSVYTGENWGVTTCQQRQSAPAGQVYSTYSPRNLLGSSGTGAGAKKLFKPYVYCPKSSTTGQQYADCFNVLCKLNGKKRADCPCPVITNHSLRDAGFFVESRNCTTTEKLCENFTSSSSSIVVNSGALGVNSAFVEKTLNFYGKTMAKSMFCIPQDTPEQEATRHSEEVKTQSTALKKSQQQEHHLRLTKQHKKQRVHTPISNVRKTHAMPKAVHKTAPSLHRAVKSME